MTLELRPGARPDQGVRLRRRGHQRRGPVGVDLGLAPGDDGEFAVTKVIDIPAEPADAADLPPALQPFGAVPPLVTDIDLSVDDRFLYVSCWGTGELQQYDVSDPFAPGADRLGAARRHRRRGPRTRPRRTERLAGGPQMVEVSRDGRRVYVTNSLYGAWDDQFYPGRRRRLDGQARRRPRQRRPHPRSRASSRTATSSAAAGCTRPGCRAATRRPTRTASRDRLARSRPSPG